MLIYLYRLRDAGRPIPRYQFAFKPPAPGELLVLECRDNVLNRATRAAEFRPAGVTEAVLLDAQLVELSSSRLVLSGIERHHDELLNRITDYTQTWVCWFSAEP